MSSMVHRWPVILEWPEMEPFSSIRGSVDAVVCCYVTIPFSSALHCPGHRYYINRLFKEHER